MSIPRVRMVAGPNGSGKTTLVEFLRGSLALRLGYCLNPDEFDKEIAGSGRIDLTQWGLEGGFGELMQFIEQHPLYRRAGTGPLKSDQDGLVPTQPVPSGYLASIVSDYLRPQIGCGTEGMMSLSKRYCRDTRDLSPCSRRQFD